jgi:hypothetical protein
MSTRLTRLITTHLKGLKPSATTASMNTLAKAVAREWLKDAAFRKELERLIRQRITQIRMDMQLAEMRQSANALDRRVVRTLDRMRKKGG